MEKPLRVFLYLGTLHKGLQGKIGKFVKVLILELNHKQIFYMEDGIQLFSVSQSTTVDDLINAQGIYLMVWVPFQMFRAWPFISGVTSMMEILQGLHTPWKRK